MKALATACAAMRRRRAIVEKRVAQLRQREAPLAAELKGIDEALELLEPMAGKGKATGGGDKAATRDAARQRWIAGQPITQIARELDVTAATLYNWKAAGKWPAQPKR